MPFSWTDAAAIDSPRAQVVRITLVLVGMLLLVAVVWVAAMSGSEIPPDELAQRCVASDPAWNGYQEDIKEIGARPVAQWHGAPIALRIDGVEVHVDMALESPWNRGPAALPILLKTPEGHVFRDSRWHREGEVCTYAFAVFPDTDTPMPPWLDIQYPHTKKRIHLDFQGQWQVPASE